jgi:hypothetical protein
MIQPKPKNYLIVILLLFIHTKPAFPFERDFAVGSREKALANAVVAVSGPFSVFHNQAFLSDAKSFAIAVDYSQPYLIKGFSDRTAAVILPTPTAIFALSITQSGIPGYSETNYGFVLSKSLGKRFSAGMQFNYFSIDFPENGTQKGTLVFEGGIGYRPSNHFALGIHCYNPFVAKIESLYRVTNIPTIVRGGCSANFSENLLFVTELAFITNNPLNIRMGFEYKFAKGLFLRGGLSGMPISHSAGIGYSRNLFSMDFAMVHHQTLGYTPSVSFIINFRK